MILLFAVFDSKAGTYGMPFTAVSTGVATRDFQHVVNDPSTVFFKHCSDFALYELGNYDADTGRIEPNLKPVFVVNASALKGGE